MIYLAYCLQRVVHFCIPMPLPCTDVFFTEPNISCRRRFSFFSYGQAALVRKATCFVFGFFELVPNAMITLLGIFTLASTVIYSVVFFVYSVWVFWWWVFSPLNTTFTFEFIARPVKRTRARASSSFMWVEDLIHERFRPVLSVFYSVSVTPYTSQNANRILERLCHYSSSENSPTRKNYNILRVKI